METLAGLPYTPLPFDAKGKAKVPKALCPPGTTDLIVISHGWKNDETHALTLYEGVIRHMLEAAGGSLDGKKLAVVGLTWPAFRFRPDLSLLPTELEREGAAAAVAADVDADELRSFAEEVAADLGEMDKDGFGRLAVFASGGGGKADELVERLRALTAKPEKHPHEREEHDDLFEMKGRDLVDRLSSPPPMVRTTAPQTVTGKGSAASFTGDLGTVGFGWLSGGKSAVAKILNQFTYYEMKARAGTVGKGLAAVLDGKAPKGVRIHLVGHSFGARLVTAAASAAATMRPASLVLLQGAFSHNGLGQGIGSKTIDGAFRNVVSEGRVTGPIAITHTHRDTAVGFFYALASSVSNEIAAGIRLADLIGGPGDLHGGIGANGALALRKGEGVAHVATEGGGFKLAAGKVNNVLADAIVSEHNDVANAGCGQLVLAAIRGG